MKKLPLTLLAALTALSVAAPASALADTQLTSDPSARNITAEGGLIAWTSREGDSWRLHTNVTAGAGAAAAGPNLPGVPAASRPYRADAGQNTSGDGVSVAYPRCDSHGRCRVFRWDAGRERRVRVFVPDGCVPVWASPWRSAVAYVVRGCTLAGVWLYRGRSETRVLLLSGNATSVELRGRRFAIGGGWWVRAGSYDRFTEHVHRVFFSPPNEGDQLTMSSPRFGPDGRLYFGLKHGIVPAVTGGLGRVRPRRGAKCEAADASHQVSPSSRASSSFAESLAWAGDRLVYAYNGKGGGVFQADPPLTWGDEQCDEIGD